MEDGISLKNFTLYHVATRSIGWLDEVSVRNEDEMIHPCILLHDKSTELTEPVVICEIQLQSDKQ